MRFALLAASLTAAVAHAQPKPAPSVADAAKALAAARANLAAAVQRIETDAPTTADLDAAAAAVTALKDAIDSGAAQEPNDLDYAKAALAARKELRERRDLVEQRRAHVFIFDRRRALAEAVATLKEAAKAVEAKEPAPKDFEAARAAAAALKKAVDESRQFVPQDKSFASFLAETDALVAKTEKAVEEKWALVEGSKHRARVEEARQAFVAAMALISPQATDADFAKADQATKALKKLLDEGQVLEAKDKTYGGYAARTRAELDAGRKKADAAWTQTGLTRLKSEIEPTAKDLAAAVKIVRARAPSQEQLAEARTTSIVARKLLEKFQAEAERSEAFARYVEGVKANLVEVEAQLTLRAVDAAVKDLRQALVKVERKTAGEDDFKVADSALLVLDKTLESLSAKDPLVGKAVADAQAWQREGRATLTRRRAEVAAAAQLAALATALKDFRQALVKLEKKAPADDDFAVARSALLVLDKTLEPMDPKNPLVAGAVTEAKAWQREGGATITRRRLELDVQAQQAKVEAARKTAGELIAGFSQPESGEAQYGEAVAAVKAITAALDEGVALKERDKTYAWYDGEVRKRTAELDKKLALRRIQLNAAAARTALSSALADTKDKLEAARRPASTDADLAAAEKQVEATNALLEGKAELETQSVSYATAAEKGRFELMKRLETLELARQERDARKRTVDALAAGLDLEDAAASSKDMRAQKRDYEKALALFKACRDDGGKLLDSSPTAGRLAVVLRGQPATVKDAVAQCAQRYDAVAPLIKPLTGLIAFEDGPRKAYEAAVKLLAAGQKTEALAQFDECTATGVTLGVRNPDLKEHVFTVAGKQMTLSELTRTCTAKSRELLGKK
ncbi:MAG: hypothetical protein AB1938_21090 [Myxococcota bacterium]